jgi:hypothetical protein
MFVRVRLPIGKPHSALLVIDRAISSDQGLKYVYVVDAQNKVQQRRIETGPLQEDGLRVITSGLKPDDWVVVGGIQQVRPRMEIVRDEEPMPTLGGVPRSNPPPGDNKDTKPAADSPKASPAAAGGAPAEKAAAEPGSSKPPSSTER